MRPVAVVFSGWPGVGKSSLARPLAQKMGAVYLRVDTIEQSLLASGVGDLADKGYRVCYALAEENLSLGNSVVVDMVNPVAVTRDAWEEVTVRQKARLVNVEVVCSDPLEHRRRVEARWAAGKEKGAPDWEQVVARVYEPWRSEVIRVDTASRTTSEALALLIESLQTIASASQ